MVMSRAYVGTVTIQAVASIPLWHNAGLHRQRLPSRRLAVTGSVGAVVLDQPTSRLTLACRSGHASRCDGSSSLGSTGESASATGSTRSAAVAYDHSWAFSLGWRLAWEWGIVSGRATPWSPCAIGYGSQASSGDRAGVGMA